MPSYNPDDDGRVSYRDGQHGGFLIAARLDQMVRERSVTGWSAQLRYLTGTASGRESLASGGVRRERLQAWLRGPETPGGAAPDKANRERLAGIYHSVRKRNLDPQIKRELNNGGRGTVIEVTPAGDVQDQSGRQMSIEELTIDNWDNYVDAWEDDDWGAMYDAWEDDADDLYGGDGAYVFVASIGF